MRKVFAVLTVLGGLALLASPASALTLAGGDYLGDFHDYSSLYNTNGSPIGLLAGTEVSPGVYVPANPFLTGTAVNPLTEKSLVYVNQLQNTDTGNIAFNSSSPTMVTGILADLKLVGATSENNGTAWVLDFAPIVSQKNALYGGMLNLYETSTKQNEYTVADPNSAGNLNSKLPATSVGIPSTGAPNAFGTAATNGTAPLAYGYPDVTNGTLLLDTELVSLSQLATLGVTNDLTIFGAVQFAKGAVLREVIDSSTGDGSGFAFAHVEDGNGDYTSDVGTLDSQLIPGYIAGSNGEADISLEFDTAAPLFNPSTGKWQTNSVYGGQGYWPETSKDPVVFGIIPEPMTMSLLGLGLAGLLARRRKTA